jgi:hypothetical protein
MTARDCPVNPLHTKVSHMLVYAGKTFRGHRPADTGISPLFALQSTDRNRKETA